MARKDTGKWVARAASTGGGRSYRGQTPVKWYGSLFLIVLLGVVFIIYSRYERQHPVAGTAPAVGTKWYAAFDVDVCGTVQPDLATNPNSAVNPGLHTNGDGVLRIEPTKAADAGNNATLARFVADYPKFGLSSSSLTIPGGKTYKNGQKCPTGTKDAGKAGKVQIKVWAGATAPAVNETSTSSDPSGIKLANGQLITVAFVPTGANIPKPGTTAIAAMQQAVSQAGQTTTTTGATVPVSTPATTAPVTGSTTATTAASTSSTVAATTTTAAGGTPSP
jgi:hypothetical protein